MKPQPRARNKDKTQETRPQEPIVTKRMTKQEQQKKKSLKKTRYQRRRHKSDQRG
jgi:hypothetical protein